MDKLDNILRSFLLGTDLTLSRDTNTDVLRETSVSKSYITILENRGLCQIVTKPTRNGLKSSNHIITNLDNVTVKDVVPSDQISDYDVPCVITLMRKSRNELHYKFVRYEKNFDEAAYISDAEKLSMNLVYVVDNPEEKVHIFNKLFSQTLEEYVPLKRIKVTFPPAPWLKTMNISSL